MVDWYNLNILEEKLNSLFKRSYLVKKKKKKSAFFPISIYSDNLEATYFSKDFIDQYIKSECKHKFLHIFKIV